MDRVRHGIGANTALFSLVNGLLFKSIPVPHLDRLAALKTRQTGSISGFSLTEERYQSLSDGHSAAIDKIFVSNPLVGALSAAGQADVVSGELVSGE